MGRGRLKMELIANERSRKTTFQKRSKGMMKKAYEFSTLCEVDVCIIIYGPKLTDRPPELQTWPQNSEQVDRIINKYKASTMSKPAKKTFDLSDMLMDRKNKVYADIYRARKEMYDAKYPTWDERIESFSENQLEALVDKLDAKLESGKRTLLSKRNGAAHRVLVTKKEWMGGNPNMGESSSQKEPCNSYMQDHYHEEDQNPTSSLNNNTVDMLQPFAVSSFDHHQPPEQMLPFDNSEQHLNNLVAPNPSSMAMWMLMEGNCNYSTLQYRAGDSSSAHSQSPLEGYHCNYSDQMNMNMMMTNNNIGPLSSSSMSHYYARLMQPAVPYMHQMMPPSISSHQLQVHTSQVKEDQYEDINQYLVMNNKMG